ncbi:MAG: hypothetical protein P9L99_00210 [Candidatus Lernaella stagnicola]|nr:hypothetical protein [Candidatus Lernaella stagnicola]
MNRRLLFLFLVLALATSLWAIGCDDNDEDDDEAGECPDPTLDISVCDPVNGAFSTTIDNPWLPLVVGDRFVLEGEDDGETIRVEIDVLDEVETVAGVETRVVRETEYEDGDLIEVSWNWFAQAADGTVCYFGEDVDIYEDDEVVSHDGAWRAGDNGAQAGILMPGDPQVGDAYYQEYWVGEAEDMGSITGFGGEISTPAGDFTDTMSVTDFNPLEDCESDDKVYVRGIGLVDDAGVKLISY